ncbi:MAG TPA: segregation/condensation protein A [Clostridiales bacterium]|jgi:segregation and condensation protein A|nr:segregation/condensation protein A [Clostridiales bacterium]
MENPTFHLEGIIKSKNEMEDFEGPLSLILMLLAKNKIEIRDIRISDILDQYLDYISKMQEMDLEVASEFVQMASHLVYIKTRSLLTGEEESSELELLISSLEQLKCRDAYAGIRAVIPEFARAAEHGLLLFSKRPEPMPRYGEYSYRHDCIELLMAMAAVSARHYHMPEPVISDRIIPRPIIYGVRRRSAQLLEMLRSGPIPLSEIFQMSKSRSELVATVISVLELCSMGNLRIGGDGDKLIVSFVGGDTESILESISDGG